MKTARASSEISPKRPKAVPRATPSKATPKPHAVAESMAQLRAAHDAVGGEITSAGGTGTYELHDWAGEVQAGSYLLMDTHYSQLALPFRQALTIEATVISRSPAKGWAVLDAGLKAFGMDHGDPSVLPFLRELLRRQRGRDEESS